MTVIDAIKLLPISEELKLQILRTLDYMDESQKLTIYRIAVNTYDLRRDMRIDENIEKQLAKVQEGKATLDSGFYDEVLKTTDEEMKKDLVETSGTVDLAAARQAMQKIVQEMQEAKLTKGTKKPNTSAK